MVTAILVEISVRMFWAFYMAQLSERSDESGLAVGAIAESPLTYQLLIPPSVNGKRPVLFKRVLSSILPSPGASGDRRDDLSLKKWETSDRAPSERPPVSG
jgi:hypothetical protein